MRLLQTVAFRLFLLIGTVATLVLTVLTFISIETQLNDLMRHVELDGDRLSDLVIRSTRHSMLLNREEDVRGIISAIGDEPGIEGIRIYNKIGEVSFSTRTSDLHLKADLSAEACIVCHPTEHLDNVRPPGDDRYRIFRTADGQRVLGLITPIRNEAACSEAPCHAHPANKTILGILDLKLSLEQVDAGIEATTNRFVTLSVIAVILMSLISGVFIMIVIHRPVHSLIAGMKDVASGSLSRKILFHRRNEIGQLADQFNVMTTELLKAREELTAWSHTLEEKVREKTGELEMTHRQMLHREKMASLGNLAASVAHELNNPLEGILTFARLLVKRIRKLSLSQEVEDGFAADLTLVGDEAQRCGSIVRNLLLFSRQDQGGSGTVQLRGVIDRCVQLISHHAEVHAVRVRVNCPPGLTLEGSRQEMEQVFLALCVNAVEAMSGSGRHDEGGSLDITAGYSADQSAVEIRVVDTGPGMTDDVKMHVFEPFFTTKQSGNGVGLGLSIVYGIVRRHKGEITVESSSASGTTFVLRLPVRQPEEVKQEEPSESTTQ